MRTTDNSDEKSVKNNFDTAASSELGISKETINELNEGINNMIYFAAHNGILINPEVKDLIRNSSVDDLLEAYNLLSKNISPATPKSILFYKSLSSKWNNKYMFNQMPLTRYLFAAAFFFLICFICTSLSSYVNMNSLDEGILNNKGLSLLVNLIYLLSLSGLGVMFYFLRYINNSIRNGTIIPEDSINFPIVIILGLISGLIISEINLFSSINDKGTGLLFNKSGLALLGGFSSDAIFSILYSAITKIRKSFEFPKESTDQ
ncbi:hypothetical protein [Flavobacterium poyangense]|uniref:hypothetical protein n=1 Tax=Flavobacterium poyangense TaxID=2204302 RepID=UPI00141F42F0|nr:hypothetical protein [Flavobacterium sp. JXAS1]